MSRQRTKKHPLNSILFFFFRLIFHFVFPVYYFEVFMGVLFVCLSENISILNSAGYKIVGSRPFSL